jgi:GNAT superfamily N-acetyltransferase
MNEIDWLNPQTLYTVVCRHALPKDTPDVLEISRHIWEGHDYVPDVWDQWREDPEGVMAVAEYGGHAVGIGKLTRLAPGQWWMEGLRVHPHSQGHGVASRLHDYLVFMWERYGDGTLGLATHSKREPVHHLCQRTGFKKIGEFTPYVAPALGGEEGEGAARTFEILKLDEASRALQFGLESASLELSYGLMDFGWEWGRPAKEYVQEALERERAWWWRDGRGLLLARDPDEDDEEEPAPLIQLVACSREDVSKCLRDFRGLAGALGYEDARWAAPLHPDLQPMLDEAGYKRDWENSIFVFQKEMV